MRVVIEEKKTPVLCSQRWQPQVRADNGEILLWGEKYARRIDAVRAVTMVTGAQEVEVHRLDGKVYTSRVPIWDD